jgi:bacterioferritin-associated ferredoxin
MRADELLKEYEELETKAHELRRKIRCRDNCEACVREATKIKQELIDITFKMDEISEALGRERKPAYH